MKVMCVAGARPNFMKIAPIVHEIDRRGWEQTLVHTGQHYDEMMSTVFFEELGIRQPDHSLDVGSGAHGEQVSRIMSGFEPILLQQQPDLLVVVGDVNSTMACALVAAKTPVVVAHVEAGLRSRDWSMPEEVNRIVTDAVSDLLLAPSADAVVNLAAEGVNPDRVRLVGNVMVDTLLANKNRALAGDTLDRFGLSQGAYVLVTLHRPALVDSDALLRRVIEALESLAIQLPVIWPVHPRTRSRLRGTTDRLLLVDPLGYLDFVALQAGARVVITDSGGVQEETTVLGVPCLTLRDSTERPITVDEGTNLIIGTDPDSIIGHVARIMQSPPLPRQPALWDGQAAVRIADALSEFVGRKRP